VKIAYLSNRFPTVVEPYVDAEIQELRDRGVEITACSILRPEKPDGGEAEFYLSPLRIDLALVSTWMFVCHCSRWFPLVMRAFSSRRESFARRLRTILQSWLGAYLAAGLRKRGIQHIHVHHGYFAAWVAMVCARMLGVGYSLTLHGSDLLVDDNFLDIKLANCKFCSTISEFNRSYIRSYYPEIPSHKILVHRMGVDCEAALLVLSARVPHKLNLLAVGRLHAVKNYPFLIHACRMLKDRGVEIACSIAGGGTERAYLERLITDLRLEAEVTLLGPVSHSRLIPLYQHADLLVLTSKSEGIPLVLMEAMALGCPVLAPHITGIPELIIDGKTGFLYEPGSMDDFVSKVQEIGRGYAGMSKVIVAARRRVQEQFNGQKNTAKFCDAMLREVGDKQESSNENSLLQQVQLSV
jgi:glycosyltransferase involved in cell wall biosynthesis